LENVAPIDSPVTFQFEMKSFAVVLFLFALCVCAFGKVRMNIGGALRMDNALIDAFKGKKVGVITAAGSQSDSRDIIAAMKSRGAVTAEWIPIVAPCARFINNTNILDKIKSLDAIYFTGGYPERLQHCLFGDTNRPSTTTPLVEEIKKKEIVAGSSAGSLIQPKKAILTTGFPSSYQVLTTWKMDYSLNGTVFLRDDILVDVHFSERGRQGRLHVLQQISGVKHAFGTDENTGVTTTLDGKYTVVGTGGVYFSTNVDRQTSSWSYLTEGDVFDFKTGAISFAAFKGPCSPVPNPPTESRRIFEPNEFTRTATHLVRYGPVLPVKNYQGSSPVVVVEMTKDGANTKAVCGVSRGKSLVSFVNLKVKFTVGTFEEVGVKGAEPFPEDYWKIEN
jgi:cyanophycinase-like exopeptidase